MSMDSMDIDDVHDPEEAKIVEEFRQILSAEDLLPERHDDYHLLVRFFLPPFQLFCNC